MKRYFESNTNFKSYKMKKRIVLKFSLLFLLLGIISNSSAQKEANDVPVSKLNWKVVAGQMPDAWYGTDEAKGIAEQVLLFQRENGGWPKNLQMHRPLTEAEKETLRTETPRGYEPTIDNDGTVTEMKFMAKMYAATKDEQYKKSFTRGLDYILEAQYDNGGWPQFYPLREGYYSHITFNDDAMVNIMGVLKEIYSENSIYAFAVTPDVAERARKAYDKGLECILKCQIYVNGKPTVWCAQHDENTLKPAKARSYELPSFSGGESVGITLMLMSIDEPSAEIIAAVEGAKTWFDEHKISGIRVVNLRDGVRDRHIVEDPEAPYIWGRFHDLETGEAFFCGRDGVKKPTLAEIEAERRNGYNYYTNAPQKVLDNYLEWKEKIAKK